MGDTRWKHGLMFFMVGLWVCPSATLLRCCASLSIAQILPIVLPIEHNHCSFSSTLVHTRPFISIINVGRFETHKVHKAVVLRGALQFSFYSLSRPLYRTACVLIFRFLRHLLSNFVFNFVFLPESRIGTSEFGFGLDRWAYTFSFVPELKRFDKFIFRKCWFLKIGRFPENTYQFILKKITDNNAFPVWFCSIVDKNYQTSTSS